MAQETPSSSAETEGQDEDLQYVSDLPVHRREALIHKIGAFVADRRLETPMLFMLEASRPLSYLGSQALVVGQPILGSFFGWERIDEIRLLFQDRENISRIIDEIESRSLRRDRGGASTLEDEDQ